MNIPGHIIRKWEVKMKISPEMAERWLEYTKLKAPFIREWDQKDLEPLIESFKEFGWFSDSPILITGDDLGDNKIIYDGVRRMAALVAIGETVEVPVRLVSNIEETSKAKAFEWWSMARESPHAEGSYNICMTFVLLVYYRWLQSQEAIEKSIAEFDGEEYTPLLPPELTDALFGEDKVDCEKITRALKGIDRPDVLGANFVLADFAPCLNKIQGALLSIQKEVLWLNFSDPSDMEYALAILDNLTTAQGKDRRELGEFSTPENIREFMVCLAAPKPGETIYDPCCGTGGLLRKAQEYMRREHSDSLLPVKISGCERSLGAYAIALCNAILSGLNTSDILLGDSLDTDGLEYDCIIAVPPVGGKSDEPDSILGVATRDTGSLMLLNILDKLKPGGRAVVCMPHGFSFRGGWDRKIRKLLVDEYCLESIGALPVGAFAPFSNIKADIYLIRNLKPEDVNHQSVDVQNLPAKAFDNSQATKKTPAQNQSNLKFIREYVAEEYREPQKFGSPPFPLSTIRDNEYDLSKRDPYAGVWFNEIFLRDYIEDDSVLVIPLSSLADLHRGIPNRREHLTRYIDIQVQLAEKPAQISHPTLLKIGDVDPKKENIKSTTHHLSPEAAEKFFSRELKPNDVLFSCAGTIGKTFLMTNDYYEEYKEGLFPASGWIRIRIKPSSASVLPGYLCAIISSPPYLEYLQALTTGSTIRHLKIEALQTLPILVPPVAIQEQVIKIVRNRKAHGRDVNAIKVLNEKLWGGSGTKNLRNLVEQDADTSFLISKISKQIANLEKHDLPETITYLNSIGSSFRQVFNKLGKEDKDPLIKNYGVNFFKAFDLLDCRGIDAATEYASIAECANSFYATLIAVAKHEDPFAESEKYCTNIITDILQILEHAKNQLLKAPYLSIETYDYDKDGFHLKITNISALPLRAAQLYLPKGWLIPQVGEQLNIDYLPEGESVPHTLPVDCSKETLLKGAHEVSVRCDVVRFDGETVETEIRVTVEASPFHEHTEALTEAFAKPVKIVTNAPDQVASETIGNNPYIAGNNNDNLELFIGRESIIDRIESDFNQTGGNHLVVMDGNRRIGKSWVLDHVSNNPDILPKWVRVHCSLLEADGGTDAADGGLPTHKVFQAYARTIGGKLHSLGHTPPGKTGKGRLSGYAKIVRTKLISEDDPFPDFRDFIDEVLEIIAPKSLLLMLDEYNILQAGIDSGVTSAQVPDNIRSIFAKPKVGGIITGTVKLKRIKEKYWGALYAIGASDIELTSMTEEEAVDVVRKPIDVSHKQWLEEYAKGHPQGLKKIKLTYTNDAVEEIIGICNKQPFLIQSLCHDMFNTAKRTGKKVIDGKFVRGNTSIIAKGTSVFTEIWRDFIPSDTQRLLLVMISKFYYDKSKARLDPLSETLIQEKLREYNVPLEEELLRPNLEDLEDLELIEYSSEFNGHYLLRVPYMGLWLEENTSDSYRDFDDLKSKAIVEIENTLN
jgi:type I restriction enzyme M protein